MDNLDGDWRGFLVIAARRPGNAQDEADGENDHERGDD
jgi:hypothetical protein